MYMIMLLGYGMCLEDLVGVCVEVWFDVVIE